MTTMERIGVLCIALAGAFSIAAGVVNLGDKPGLIPGLQIGAGSLQMIAAVAFVVYRRRRQ